MFWLIGQLQKHVIKSLLHQKLNQPFSLLKTAENLAGIPDPDSFVKLVSL